jgi:hypothetical protein
MDPWQLWLHMYLRVFCEQPFDSVHLALHVFLVRRSAHVCYVLSESNYHRQPCDPANCRYHQAYANMG